jgi:hypothetical protein
LVFAATSLPFSTGFSIGFTALVVPAIFVAFVTLAGLTALVPARRFAVALRSAARVALLRVTSAF